MQETAVRFAICDDDKVYAAPCECHVEIQNSSSANIYGTMIGVFSKKVNVCRLLRFLNLQKYGTIKTVKRIAEWR